MSGYKWNSFEKELPSEQHYIMVRDHEGNLSPGMWQKKFIPFLEIPIGRMVKWTYIEVYTCPGPPQIPGSLLLDLEQMLYENGKKIMINELYDFEDP